MPFVITKSNILVNDFNFVKNYQDTSKTNHHNFPSFLTLPSSLGGKSRSRIPQASFLDKMQTLAKINAFKDEDIQTIEEYCSNIIAVRIMLAASLYVKDQINATYKTGGPQGRSILYTQINEALGIIENQNDLDEEDRQLCFKAAQIICLRSDLSQINIKLKQAKVEPFSNSEWSNFTHYLERQLIQKVQNGTDYPVTGITQQFFGSAGSCIGMTLGVIAGDVINRSNAALTPKTKYTAVIGSSVIAFNYVGPAAGLALLTPVITEQIINTFFRVSLAYGLKLSMNILGQGIGIAVGVPLDLTWHAFRALVHNSFASRKSLMTGIRLCDGTLVIEGVPLKERLENEFSANGKQINIEIREGKLYLDENLIDTSDTTPDVLLEKIINDLNNEAIVKNSAVAANGKVKAMGLVDSEDVKEALSLG